MLLLITLLTFPTFAFAQTGPDEDILRSLIQEKESVIEPVQNDNKSIIKKTTEGLSRDKSKANKANRYKGELKSKRSVKAFIFFGYDLTTAEFEYGFIDTSPGVRLDSDFDIENSFSFGFELRKPINDIFDFSVGITYMMEREIESGKFVASLDGEQDSSSVSYNPGPKVSALRINSDFIYNVNQIYLLGGVNFATINYEPPADNPNSFSANGGLGLNFGGGINISEKACFEFKYQYSILGLEARGYIDSEPFYINYGAGYLKSYTFAIKFAIN